MAKVVLECSKPLSDDSCQSDPSDEDVTEPQAKVKRRSRAR